MSHDNNNARDGRTIRRRMPAAPYRTSPGALAISRRLCDGCAVIRMRAPPYSVYIAKISCYTYVWIEQRIIGASQGQQQNPKR